MDYQLGPGPLQVDQNTTDEKIKGDIGIVENGDIATHAILKDYYVIWKGKLYKAKTDISSGTTLSAESNGNLDPKSNGLGGEVAALNSKLAIEGFISTAYDTSVLNDVRAIKIGTCAIAKVEIKAGIPSQWYNDIQTGIPQRLCPPTAVYGSYRVNGSVDINKKIICQIGTNGTVQFLTSEVFTASIPVTFTYPVPV